MFYAGYAPGADQEVNLKYIFKLDTPNLGTNTGQCTIYNKSSLKRLTLLVVKTTESNGSPVKWDRVLYGPKVDRHSLLERWKMKSEAGRNNQAGNQLISAFQEGQVGEARFMLSKHTDTPTPTWSRNYNLVGSKR